MFVFFCFFARCSLPPLFEQHPFFRRDAGSGRERTAIHPSPQTQCVKEVAPPGRRWYPSRAFTTKSLIASPLGSSSAPPPAAVPGLPHPPAAAHYLRFSLFFFSACKTLVLPVASFSGLRFEPAGVQPPHAPFARRLCGNLFAPRRDLRAEISGST